MKELNFAILGTGMIAHTMARTVIHMDGICLYAVASRDEERARSFAGEFGAERFYGSYESLIQDENVGLIYIATPHSHHYRYAKACLEAGRPVLCEKAFTRTADEAHSLIRLSEEKNVFITEAMWPRYMPMTERLREILRSGRIGRVTSVTATMGAPLMQVERMIRPELAGGALLDLGVYSLNFITQVLGDEPETVSSTMVRHETGVDRKETISLLYPDGTLAGIYNSMESASLQHGWIYGTEGYILAEGLTNFQAFRIYDRDGREIETVKRPEQITGYEYEVEACRQALEEKKIECSEMPHAHTLKIMELTDRIQAAWKR